MSILTFLLLTSLGNRWTDGHTQDSVDIVKGRPINPDDVPKEPDWDGSRQGLTLSRPDLGMKTRMSDQHQQTTLHLGYTLTARSAKSELQIPHGARAATLPP